MKTQPYTFTTKKSNKSKIKKRNIKITKANLNSELKAKLKGEK